MIRFDMPTVFQYNFAYPIKRLGEIKTASGGRTAAGARDMVRNKRTPLIQPYAFALLAIRIFVNMTMATLGKFVRKAGPRVMAV